MSLRVAFVAAGGLMLACRYGTLEIGSYGEAGLVGAGGQTAASGASSVSGSNTGLTGQGGALGAGKGMSSSAGTTGDSAGGQAGDGSGVSEGGEAGGGGAADGVRVVEIATGSNHNCARLSDGRVRCWGVDPGSGALGLLQGASSELIVGDDETPASVADIDVGGFVMQIAVGDYSTCALLDDGNVRCWGSHFGLGYANGQFIGDDEPPSAAGNVQVGGRVRQIAAGYHFTCALLEGGTVRCWGVNPSGNLGYGHREPIGDDELPFEAGDVDVGGPVAQIAVGLEHVCALMTTGSLRCWGYGFPGSLGYGNTQNIGDDETPASAGDVDVGGPVRQVAAGAHSTCALLVDGAVRCWGDRAPRQLGAPYPIGDDETPASVPPIEIGGNVTAVSVTGDQACALLDTGGVRCWGNGPNRALGYGNLEYIGDDETPASAGDLKLGGPVVQIGAEWSHSCALHQNGDVRCWGGNIYDDSVMDRVKRIPLGLPFLEDPIGDDDFPDRYPPIEIFDP